MGVKELTIVIPSYNTASFMEKNVQTMIHDELLNSMEILIINDGSKDNTLETAYKLQKKYPNCIRVVNKPNGGHGSVINKGIEEATGRYFKVIDGDDYVDTHELIKFVSTLKTIDDDCILSMYNTVSAVSGEIKIQNPYIKSALILNNKSYSTETILPSITATIHAITYKTELLKNHLDQIKVLEGVFYEDMEFVTYPIVYCESIYISDAIVYQYLIDQANQSVSLSNHRNRIGDSITGVYSMIAHYNNWQNSITHVKRNYVIKRINERIKGIYRLILSFPDNIEKHKLYLIDFDSQIKSRSSIIYSVSGHDPIISILRKTKFHAYIILNLLLRRS